MKLLREDLAALDEAWRSEEIFCLVSERPGVSEEWLREAHAALPAEWQRGTFTLLTSGSTGQPKLIVGSRARAEELARTLHDAQESEPCGEAVVALPLSYSYCFVNQWLWARVHGRKLTATHGFARPDELAAALRQSTSALLCLVGGQVPLLAQLGEEAFPGVLRLHFAGGAFPQQALPALRQRFPAAQIFNNFGCAEAMPRLTLRKAEDAELGRDVGKPIPGVRLRTGAFGELLFQSDYQALGCFESGAPRAFGKGEWIPTGDLGAEQPDGHWLLEGRASEVFKRYGEKVSLPLLLATVHTAWPHGAAFYRQRDRAGEEGHVLVLSPEPSADQVREVLLALRKAHARPLWPLRLESVESLPLLPNGKVDVRALAEAPARKVHWEQRI